MNRYARAVAGAGVLAGAALLASCGGGEQVESYTATRVLAFGDESSVINANGGKYTVNALVAGSTTQFDCTTNPVWIQLVAAHYGLVFPQCPGFTVVDPTSRIYATNGATVSDLISQIDTHLANGGGFVGSDIATVFVGANDVVAQFQQYPTIGEDQLSANLTAAGLALAQQVNRLAGYGAKVLIVTVPDMGLTPFAGDRSVGSTDSNPALLTRLSTKFNDALLANILNDGHKIGLIQLDEYLKAVDTAVRNVNNNGSGFSNSTQVACAVALPNCTTNTLVADAVNSPWLWADSRHLAAGGQSSLGTLAVSRASNNPF
ncbi:MAG TPA: SGNH/GDSL hydrolase family protein [Burkholderiaceae bacterium]|nr:SGNH/GDSL hydrolase family protein [Burkholderiaceae bacterium]